MKNRRRWAHAALALVTALGTSGEGSNARGMNDQGQVGSPVASLSQARHTPAALESLARLDHPVVLRTDEDLRSWLAQLDPTVLEIAQEALGSALGTSWSAAGTVVVIGSYHRCRETSSARLLADGTVRFEVKVPAEQVGVLCAWAPTTVDIWVLRGDAQVERAQDAA